MVRRRRLAELIAIEEPGDPEKEGHEEGEFGMLHGMEPNVYYAVNGPGNTTDEPDPGGFPHTVLDAKHAG